MKINGKLTGWARTALALAATITLGLTASACSNGVSIPDGDYLGAATYHSDVSDGYVHLAVTVAGGTVTGTATIYDFLACPVSTAFACAASVPTGSDSFAVTGTTDGKNISMELTGGDATVTGTLEADGTLAAELLPTTPATNFISYAMIYPDSGSETAFVCGGFGFGLTPTTPAPASTNGNLAAFVTEDGNVFGILASDTFTGTLSATYAGGGVSCGSTSCGNDLTGTVSGTFNDLPVSFNIDTAASGLDFVTNADYPGDFTYAGMEANMKNTTQNGGFGGTTTGCMP